MKPYVQTLVLFIATLTIPATARQSVFMVIEQDAWDNAAHRAVDFTNQIDSLDPILQFILLETPNDPDMAQVLWEVSETPIPWLQGGDVNQSYHLVEYAILPDDGRIDYRIIDEDTGDELTDLRHSRDADDENIYIDDSILDSLPEGEYTLQAILRIPKRQMQIMTQKLSVIDSFEDLDEPDDSDEVLPLPPTPVEGEKLDPGNGWDGPTTVPKQIGDSHEPAIAHWNVVPEQQVEDDFAVGVIAHHLDGINYVEISANNGPWIRIDKPSINPRTQCEEYWTILDLGAKNEKIELRAIAVPYKGKPALVTPLGKTYREQDMTLYPYEVGEVLELPAGEHNLSSRNLPDTGWLIVRPAPGVAREDCILVGESKDWGKGRLKLDGLTLKMPKGNNTMRGKWDLDEDGHYHGCHVWFNNCRLIGNGPKDSTSYPVVMWETQTFTDSEISHVQTAFHSHGAINLLARNCYVHDIYEDIFRSSGLHVNVTIEDVDREPLVAAKGLTGNDRPHPDIWQFQNLPNTIAQDITATKNINAQGLFPKDVKNVALKRVKIETVSPYFAMQIMGDTQNLLIEDSVFDGGAGFRGNLLEGERIIFRNSVAGSMPPYLPVGWEQAGIDIQDMPTIAPDND